MAENELSDDARRFVVTELACWQRPSAVAKAVKEQFGITVTRQAIERYNPYRAAGSNLTPELKTLFDDTRSKFRDERSDIGIYDRIVRMRMLDNAARAFEEMGNYLAMAQILEQAAREEGDSFTNKHQHEHSGKVDIPQTATVILTGAPSPASAPQAVGGVPKPSN